MVTRKSTPKATITDAPFVETPAAAPEAAAPESTFFERLQAEFNNLSGTPPIQVSWKRAIVAFTASLLVSGVLGYVAGLLISYMMIGALLLTGSAFLALTIYFLGIVAAMYAGYRIGPIAYLAVVDKSVDRAFYSAKGWVTGLFTTPGVTA